MQESTTHPDNPKAEGSKTPDGKLSSTFKEDCLATFRTIAWKRLKVLSTEDGSRGHEQYVTFEASFQVVNQLDQRRKGSALQKLRERSRFLNEGDRWLYVDGEENITAGAK